MLLIRNGDEHDNYSFKMIFGSDSNLSPPLSFHTPNLSNVMVPLLLLCVCPSKTLFMDTEI